MASNKFCPECGAPNVNGGKFCSQCGSKFPEADNMCPNCGAVLPAESAFCSACGARVATQPPPVIHSEPIPANHEHHYEPGQKVVKDGVEYTVEKNGMLMRNEGGVKYVEAGSFFAAQFAERERRSAPTGDPQVAPPQHPPRNEPQQPAWESSVTPPEEEPYQPLWDPRAESAQSAERQASAESIEDPKMTPLDYLQSIKATPKNNVDEDVPQEDISPKSKWGMKRKNAASLEGSAEQMAFQSTVNADGYYNDRQPYDYDSLEDDRRKIQWVPLILGVVGIILFAFVAIQLSQYL